MLLRSPRPDGDGPRRVALDARHSRSRYAREAYTALTARSLGGTLLAVQVCARPGCETVLSRYNHGSVCAPHERFPLVAERFGDEVAGAPWDVGKIVPFDRALLSTGTKGWRGLCSDAGCTTEATVCRRDRSQWRAWCLAHCPPSAEAMAAYRVATDEVMQAAERERNEMWDLVLSSRPLCRRCGKQVAYCGHVVLWHLGPECFHRVCALEEVGVAVTPPLTAELDEMDNLDLSLDRTVNPFMYLRAHPLKPAV